MARAHNTAERGSGRTMSGGLDATAMAKPKAFFGSARNIPDTSGGGSLKCRAIAATVVHVGPPGMGARAKLATNLVLGLNRAAFAEGLAFAERMGLDLAKFFEIARASAAHSQVMDTKGGKMVTRDFSPHGRAAQALKDVRLMLAEAARAGQELPGCAVAAALLESCVRHGEGERDSTVIVEEIRRRGSAAARGAAQ